QLDGALDLSGSPRDLVQRLADKQRRLEEELLGEARQLAGKEPEELKAALLKIQKAQSAIEQALQEKVLDQAPKAAQEAHREAVQSAGQASKLLLFDAVQAREHMEQSRQALENLAQMLPGGSPAEDGPAPKKSTGTMKAEDLQRHVEKLH